MLSPGLYVVATPIGNLEDISHRAVRVLSEVDLIAAEDTRHSRVLLDHYGIKKTLLSLHEHNESERIPAIVEKIRDGAAVALISDAGTPSISDPGFRLVGAILDRQLAVVPVPGPSAVTAALSVGGIASDRFWFEGFLPSRQSARVKRLETLSRIPITVVLFESSHRIRATLADMQRVFGPAREAALCRELTKRFETVIRGSIEHIGNSLESDPDQSRGEFVLLVSGHREQRPTADGFELARALRDHLPASQAARVAAKVTGASRRDLYQALKGDSEDV